jgi:hypothetical protein
MAARSRYRRFRIAGAVLAAIALASTSAAGAGAADPSAPGSSTEHSARAASRAVGAPSGAVPVRLVTGELFLVDVGRSGPPGVAPVDEGLAVTWSSTTDAAGDVHVVPDTARPWLDDVLDPRLFNVSALVRDGYGADERPVLPVIVTYTDGPVPVPGVTTTQELPSIGGTVGFVDPAGARALGAAITLHGDEDGTPFPGVERIWLDALVEASRYESTPAATGADAAAPELEQPVASVAGGVTIAVVDTGVDADHPGLAGRLGAAEVFAAGASTGDALGHGTNVALMATSGAAGTDAEGGSADVRLVSAKVLDDAGRGLESAVIAGIEWAATTQGADVVNLSLNSAPTDGTDPLSRSIDELSRSTDALFVVSAGDGGRTAPGAVEAPAAAAAALAVGAVDESTDPPSFAVVGPRIGGHAVKPEIVVGGASPSAAEVTGAAAALRQAHPDWDWQQVKSTLVTSAARLGHSAYTEGGGRLDHAAAMGQTVHADAATPRP